MTAITVLIDWGSSRFRAFKMQDNKLLDSIVTDSGVLSFNGRGFTQYLQQVLAPWGLPENTQILMAGMVGSKNGWIESDYVVCPAGLSEVAAKLTAVDNPMGWRLAIVPGVAKLSEPVDVMRGEECQVFGSEVSDGWVCLPGTHSKWMRLERGKIVDFTTFMTGELFALLNEHGSLAALVTDQVFDQHAFIAGLDGADEILTQQLFGIRARAVLDKTDFADSQSYLSGLLIGQEFKAAAARKTPITTFHLVAASQLTDLYAMAALHFDMECEVLDIETVSYHGLLKVLKESSGE